MIVDNPVVMTPSAPLNRPPAGDRPGGGRTVVVAESLRPLDEVLRTAAGRCDGAAREVIPGGYRRDDAEIAARVRVGVAREQAAEAGRDSARRGMGEALAADFIPAAEIRRLRERLAARMSRDPGMITLRSIDVRA